MPILEINGKRVEFANMPTEQEIDEVGNSIKQESIPQMLGRNLIEAAKETYREGIAPIVHGASTFAFGIPKAVAKATGTEQIIYPEQQTLVGKALRFPAEAYGYLGGGAARVGESAIKGAVRLFPKLAGKQVYKQAIKGAIGGGAYGLSQVAPEGKSQLQQAGEFAAIGGAIPPVIGTAVAFGKGLGQIVTKSGRWVAKNIGGISDATVNIIKRLGADKVFDPIKANIDYISSNIVPRVKERVTGLITNFSEKSKPILKDLGFKAEQIEDLSSIDKKTLNSLKDAFTGDWNAMQKSLEGIKNNADKMQQAIFEKNPNAKVFPKDTFYKLQNILRQNNWIDSQGNEVTGTGIKNITRTNLVKIYNYMKDTLVQTGKKRIVGYLNPQQYFSYLNDLEASISGNPKFDRFIYELSGSLRKDAAKTIPGLVQANKVYSDALKLIDLQPALEKATNILTIDKNINQLKNVTKAQLHLQYKRVLGKDIYDDILAHLANQDFELISNLPKPAGGVYPSRAGIIRTLVGKGAKGYYKNIQPKMQNIRQALKNISLKNRLYKATMR